MSEESHVWKGRPSQITNLATFIICGLTFVLVVPLVIGLWRWLSVRCTEYRLSTERLTLSWGVLSRRVEELELYRVKDTGIDQPFFLRIFHLGNVVLRTSDRSHPVVVLKAIPDCRRVREQVRGLVEEARERKGVREFDHN